MLYAPFNKFTLMDERLYEAASGLRLATVRLDLTTETK